MTPLIPCRACNHKVSITAPTCPNCGDNVQGYIKDEFPTRAVGFPIGPLASWEPHFWYYGGCKGTDVVPALVGWVNRHEPLLTLSYHDGEPSKVVIKSPFNAIVVRDRIRIDKHVDINYPGWGGINDREFVVLRPKRSDAKEGAPFEQVDTSYAYNPLRDRIHEFVARVGLFGPSNKGYRKFDPKNIFDSKEAVLQKALQLSEVKAVWLPDWDFREQYYSFS
jgi:hypothetical protein